MFFICLVFKHCSDALSLSLYLEVRGMAVFHFISERYWLYDEESSEEEK